MVKCGRVSRAWLYFPRENIGGGRDGGAGDDASCRGDSAHIHIGRVIPAKQFRYYWCVLQVKWPINRFKMYRRTLIFPRAAPRSGNNKRFCPLGIYKPYETKKKSIAISPVRNRTQFWGRGESHRFGRWVVWRSVLIFSKITVLSELSSLYIDKICKFWILSTYFFFHIYKQNIKLYTAVKKKIKLLDFASTSKTHCYLCIYILE